MIGRSTSAALALVVVLGACTAAEERRPRPRRARLALGSADAGNCGAVTAAGCCSGQVLYYCESNKLLDLDCAMSPACGWDVVNGHYDCNTPGTADPAGAHPMSCPALPAPVPCGSVTFEGCCHGEVLYYCEDGLQIFDCTQAPGLCGWDPQRPPGFYSCGTDGGADPTGAQPKACPFDAGVPDSSAPQPCGKIPSEGCCDGATLLLCVQGALQNIPCSSAASCGWYAYLGVYSCETDGKPDPGGSHPRSCNAVRDAGTSDGGVPCGNVTSAGCCHGQTRYHCVSGALQSEDCRRHPSCGWGLIVPQYICGTVGKPDPTGAVPMSCDFNDAGPAALPDTCGDLTWRGCCDGQTLRYCEGGAVKTKDCGKDPICGWKTSGGNGFYDCGTTGAAEPSGQLPRACGADAGAGVADAAPGCGPVPEKGCCLDGWLYYCAAGAIRGMDCRKSPSCGWQPAADYYDCAAEGDPDPTGLYPMTCAFDGGAPILDAGGPRDASLDFSGGDVRAVEAAGGGCGCAVARRSPGAAWVPLLLLLVVAVFWRFARRRGAAARHGM